VSSIHDLKEVGFIVGEATSTEFIFVSEKEKYPQKWEYLTVQSREYVDGKLQLVNVLAQVERIASKSEVMTQQLDVEALERIKRAGIDEIRTLGRARVLGYVIERSDGRKEVLLPRRAVVPGQHIYVAPKEVLTVFFSYPPKEALYIGDLISRPDVPVYLSVSGFRRHLAIIAQTGAGKSYCAGVFIEELLDKGASIIVVDPHADYAFLPLTQSGEKYGRAERITVFRNPASTGRYSAKEVGNLQLYEIAFQDLSFDEVCEVAGIREDYTKIREAVRVGVERLKEEGKHYLPNDLLASLEGIKDDSEEERDLRAGAAGALKYIRRLVNLKVFGLQSTSTESLLKPMHVSVIDLSGLEDISMDYIASKILVDTFNVVANGDFSYPVFVILEEAHKFIPGGDRSTYSSSVINKIAAEGRKFGVFLLLITQRPSKVHPDSLSQCNSQIIMKLTNPQDQKAVAESSERVSQDLLNDLPGLNPGEAVVVGEVTKAPVMLRIRSRRTREGGADIDVVEKLRQARQELKVNEIVEKDRRQQIPFRGDFSKV
jgi:DNA helicase HerA-like ATPase